MKNHLSVNHFCLLFAAAALLVGTVARAQNPTPPAPQVAPAKAPDSLSIYFDPGSAVVTAQSRARPPWIRPLALIETVNRLSWWSAGAPISTGSAAACTFRLIATASRQCAAGVWSPAAFQ